MITAHFFKLLQGAAGNIDLSVFGRYSLSSDGLNSSHSCDIGVTSCKSKTSSHPTWYAACC